LSPARRVVMEPRLWERAGAVPGKAGGDPCRARRVCHLHRLVEPPRHRADLGGGGNGRAHSAFRQAADVAPSRRERERREVQPVSSRSKRVTKIMSATALLTMFSLGSPALAEEPAKMEAPAAAAEPAKTEPGAVRPDGAQPGADARADSAPDLKPAEAAAAATPAKEAKPAKTTKLSKKKAAKKAEAKPTEVSPAAK